MLLFSHRTSPLHLPRQALHAPVAALCRCHPANYTGKGREHAYARHESPAAAAAARNRPRRIVAAPDELPRAHYPRRHRTEEARTERGRIGPLGHLIMEAATPVWQLTAPALHVPDQKRETRCQLTARTLLA
jgi:hypothetical protein